MIIPCKDIAQEFENDLRSRTAKLRSQGEIPKLVTILLGSAPEQLSFVKIKERLAHQLDIEFEFIHLKHVPSFEDFLLQLDEIVRRNQTSGIIVQHPLPHGYDHNEIYKHLSMTQDIEGHKPDSPFIFPLALSVLSGLKHVLIHQTKKGGDDSDVTVDLRHDASFFAHQLTGKKVVIAGRGDTGGGPIAAALEKIGVKYTMTHSQTRNPDAIYRQADIIITATGTHIVTSKNIKEGVVLLNVGLRKKDGRLQGDYEEEDIDAKASWYNKTPGGLGPIDVLYLYSNLLDSACSM
ncbi:MAG: bifunctional 5,10-methylenetetrahydrofolate dehydrogenase/5,10-methenyltetrahydrofolate cyclohydrolase [bacterium]|nr:bifunctional 5,10-methylenetetrahydrofolate dehydrogenase/5,10-methenyltetrahydrofolate cyclohydrolase [bacterium]